VGHVSDEDNLLETGLLDDVVEGGVRERAGELLTDNNLVRAGG
jgi:hypothetical protein